MEVTRDSDRWVFEQIVALPDGLLNDGTLGADVCRKIIELASAMDLRYTVETGCGKSTLLLSHLSAQHTVFTVGVSKNLNRLRESQLMKPDSVHFVEGPTQLTLPTYSFEAKIQLALLDGPHGFPFPTLEYFWIYPHLEPGALLIVDDIHIPTVNQLYAVLREDDMFELIEVVQTTAFLRRTGSVIFPTTGDGWELQTYNKSRFPCDVSGAARGGSLA